MLGPQGEINTVYGMRDVVTLHTCSLGKVIGHDLAFAYHTT